MVSEAVEPGMDAREPSGAGAPEGSRPEEPTEPAPEKPSPASLKAKLGRAVLLIGLMIGLPLLIEGFFRLREPPGSNWLADREARVDKLLAMPPKKPAELRVFTFGESTVFGMPVPEL